MTALYIAVILLGGFVGFYLEKATVHLINNRVSEQIIHRFSGSIKNTVVWILLNSFGWFTAFYVGGLNPKTVECALLISVCLVLSAVDITIKKIPNEAILFILVIGTTFVIINNQISVIKLNLIGFAVGFIMFLLPTMIGKGAGLGDVKYAAAVGFCLGVYGFLTAIIIMTLSLVIYTVYLIITRKGTLKTKIALAPFMSIGFIAVLFLNIINNNQMLFDLQQFLNH